MSLHERWEAVLWWLAYHLPRRIAYLAAIRVGAHATTGRWGHEETPALLFTTAISRWTMSNELPPSSAVESYPVRAVSLQVGAGAPRALGKGAMTVRAIPRCEKCGAPVDVTIMPNGEWVFGERAETVTPNLTADEQQQWGEVNDDDMARMGRAESRQTTRPSLSVVP